MPVPDQVRDDGSGIQKFRMVCALDSAVEPGNDKSLRDKEKPSSPEGEAFPPSPIGTLREGRVCWSLRSFGPRHCLLEIFEKFVFRFPVRSKFLAKKTTQFVK